MLHNSLSARIHNGEIIKRGVMDAYLGPKIVTRKQCLVSQKVVVHCIHNTVLSHVRIYSKHVGAHAKITCLCIL